MLHMWELRTAQIDYFYLTRNCAFEMLTLLETAAPRLDLVGRLKGLVVPVDVVRAISDVPGLVRGVAYRPSLESRLHARLATLTNTEQLQVRKLLRDPGAAWPVTMPDDRRALALDAAMFELEAHSSEDLERLEMNAAKRTWLALVARREGVPPEARVPVDWSKRPDLGHGPMRVLVGAGVTSQYGGSFGSIGYRLALHELTDPADGWPELAQVVMLDTKLRYAWPRNVLSLDTLTFADLLALSPVAPAEPRISFRIRAFGERLHDRDCPDCFSHGADGSVGATVATAKRRVALFMMADAYIGFLPHATGLDSSVVRIGLGSYGGLRVHVGDAVALLTGTVSYLPGERLTSTYDARLTIKYAVGRDLAFGVELVAPAALGRRTALLVRVLLTTRASLHALMGRSRRRSAVGAPFVVAGASRPRISGVSRPSSMSPASGGRDGGPTASTVRSTSCAVTSSAATACSRDSPMASTTRSSHTAT